MSLKLWMIPMKGKGHERTALNRALGSHTDLSFPLTTDAGDNALLFEYEGCSTDTASGQEGLY